MESNTLNQPIDKDKTKGKPVCLITGVGEGTGAALARRFAKGGYSVAMIARDRDRLDKLEEELPGSRAFEKLVLPHSGFQIRIPLGLYYKTGGGLPDGRGVQPDFVIARTPEDLKTNRDPVLEKALELASK